MPFTTHFEAFLAAFALISGALLFFDRYVGQGKTLQIILEDIKKLINRVSKTEVEIKNLETNIKNLETNILSWRKADIGSANSPISLTDLGKEIAIEINADEIFKKHRSALEVLVEKKELKSAYDIQEVSMKVVEENLIEVLTPEESVALKEVAFSRGKELGDFMIIFGVKLRDYILDKHDIQISEVDTDNPNKLKK